MNSSIGPAHLLLAALWFAVAGGAAGFVAVRATRAAVPSDVLERATVGVLLWLAQAIGIPLLLSMVKLLAPAPVLAAHVLLALVVGRRVREPAVPGRPAAYASPGRSAGSAVAVGMGAAMAALASMSAVLSRPSLDFETRHYHIANLASWLQRGSLWPLPYQNPAFVTGTHPGNGEMLGVWLALPVHGDELVGFINLGFGLLTVLAVALLARQLGGPAWAGALAAFAVLGTPVIFASHAYALGTDVAASGALVAAVAFVHRATREEPAPWGWFAGLALGLAVGSKYTALIPGGLIGVWALVRLRPARGLATVMPGVLLLAGPWLARNAVATGNPIFAQDVTLFGHTILAGYQSPLKQLATPLAAHLAHLETGPIRGWLGVVWHRWGPAALFVPFGVAPGVFRRNRLAVALLAAGAFLAYTVLPFTGDLPLAGSNTRYAMPAALLAGALLVAALPRLVWMPLVAAGLAYDAFQIAANRLPRRPDLHVGWGALAVVAIGLAAAFVWRGPSRWTPPRPRRWSGWTPGPLARGVALCSIAAVLAAALTSLADRSWPRSPLELVAAQARAVSTDFVAVGAFDLRSILGPRLDVRLSTLSAGGRSGEEPYADPDALTRALEASGARVGVFPTGPQLSLPNGWSPPASEWCDLGGSRYEHVWVRLDPGQSCDVLGPQ